MYLALGFVVIVVVAAEILDRVTALKGSKK